MSRQPYYSANAYYKDIFGHKAYKISLNGGMSCPNRDGNIGYGGCIFCSAAGSGDFAAGTTLSITEQITEGIDLIKHKCQSGCYIAYFQAYTNTYAPADYLKELFYTAIHDRRIAGLSIATRPDCLEPEKIELLKELNTIKPVWVELGLQTTNPGTALYIRRGYALDVFDDAVLRLHNAGIKVIVHMIAGLPNETESDILNTAKYIASKKVHGIKIQLLHVLKGTDLARDYELGLFDVMDRENYIKTVVDIVEILPPNMVIYRITGDGPRNILIAPKWSTDKKNILNMINREFSLRNTYQGRKYETWL